MHVGKTVMLFFGSHELPREDLGSRWKLATMPEWHLNRVFRDQLLIKEQGKKKSRQQPHRSLTAQPQHTGQDLSKSTEILQAVLKDYFKVTANNCVVYRWSTPSEVLRCNLNSQTPSRSCTKWQYWSTSEDSAGVLMTTAPCMVRHVSTCFSVNLSCCDTSESGGESSCDWTRWQLVKDSGHALSHESCRSQQVSTPRKEEMRQPCVMLL